jgi:hypothetical protein
MRAATYRIGATVFDATDETTGAIGLVVGVGGVRELSRDHVLQ